jgi:O-antigen/teichoic acid export membrane protein
VVLNLILIPRLGINGAAIAFAAGIVVDNAIVTIAVRVFLKMHPFGRGYPIVAIGSLACYGAIGLVIRFSLGMSVASFLLYCVVATELYVALLWRYRTTLQLHALREALRLPGQRRGSGGG